MDHPYDLHKLDGHLTEVIDHAKERHTAEAFDAMVRVLLEVEQRNALRVNGHHIMEAAERVQRLSPLFAAVDIDDCVRRLEHCYAAHRAIHEMSHG